MTIHPKHMEWITARGIDPKLAEKFGLETVQREGKAWLAMPYREGGETINHKYRRTGEKDFRMETGKPLLLYNADILNDPKVRSGQAPVVITEGEMDAIAVEQAGHPYVVSVPGGAPSKATDDLDNAKRYEWVDRHADQLAKVKQFVIAADDDQAGWNLRTDLVALLGADRCKFVEHPFPSKDLNDVLVDFGPERVVECITTAKEFPVQGLYTIDDFPEKGAVRSFPIGIEPIKDLIHIVPGTLTVLTGYSNMGKSTLMNAIIGHALRHLFPVCVASFETDVRPILIDGLSRAMAQTHNLSDEQRKIAVNVLRERLHIISQSVDEDMEMDLDQFLDLCRIAVRRGAKMIVLDPWNELEHKRRRDETETDYIGRAIRAIKRFAKQYDVAFWIVAHPTKPMQGVNKIPGLYDISGSANWANKPDYGLTYHRPDPKQNRAVIRVHKVRMGLPGMKDETEVMFDFRDHTFKEAM